MESLSPCHWILFCNFWLLFLVLSILSLPFSLLCPLDTSSLGGAERVALMSGFFLLKVVELSFQ